MTSRDDLVEFAEFALDYGNERLLRGTQVLPLRPKAFALLRFLLSHPGVLISKARLLESVWENRVISEGGLTELIRELRKALDDDAKAPRFIETVHRRGYRFIGLPAATPKQAAALQRSPTATPVFRNTRLVGRDAELERMRGYLAGAEAGNRQIVFVTGEPGIGKTTLLMAFASLLNQSAASTDSVRVAWGQCIEQYGSSEPYLPVLHALSQLIDGSDAMEVIDVLSRHAPTLLKQFPAMIDQEQAVALERRTLGATHERMLREITDALEHLSGNRLLVLILEDLHWSDYSTLDLVSYLAQRTGPARLMLVASFRPVEVYTRQHPLKDVLNELAARQQCSVVPLPCLNQDAVRLYVEQRFDKLEDRPPLDSLATAIYRRTDGHPLFVVNVADYIQARNFESLPESVLHSTPESVRQMIEKQLDRLSPDEKRVLEFAAIAGADFSVASIALTLDADDVEFYEDICARLEARAQFICSNGSARWPDGTYTSRYAFIHALYQNVLYFSVPAGKRARLHEQLGLRLEQAWGDKAADIATELATHFEAGQNPDKAVKYFALAGEKAVSNWSDREAIDLFTRALDLLKGFPDSPQRRQQEVHISIAMGVPLIHVCGYAARQVGDVYERARELYADSGEGSELLPALWGLWLYYVVRGEHRTALDISSALLKNAEARKLRFPLAHYAFGGSSFWMGDPDGALASLNAAISVYEPETDLKRIDLYSQDAKTVSLLYRGWSLWFLGFADRGLKSCTEAVDYSRSLGHPFSIAFAHSFFATLRLLRREFDAALEQGEAAMNISSEHGFPLFEAWGRITYGRALAGVGDSENGIATLIQGIRDYEATGAQMGKTCWLSLLADAYLQVRQVTAGGEVLRTAQTFAQETGETAFIPELWRLEGELLLATNPVDTAPVDRCFEKAIAVARRQGAKTLQLRARTSLARLHLDRDSAGPVTALAQVCDEFSEGFATQDWHDARALVDRAFGGDR